MHNSSDNFALALNKHLLDLDRPVSWLARRLGISVSKATRWSSGTKLPGMDEIFDIAKVLDIDSNERQNLLLAAGYNYVEETKSLVTLKDDTQKDDAYAYWSLNFTKGTLGDMSRLFGKVLSQMIKSHQLSQQNLAERMGVSRSAVSQWHTSTRIPDVRTLHGIGDGLGLSASEKSDLATAWVTAKTANDLRGYIAVAENAEVAINVADISRIAISLLRNQQIEKLMNQSKGTDS